MEKILLAEYFEQHGEIESVELPLSRETQKPRGFGFITFNDFDTVDKLVGKRNNICIIITIKQFCDEHYRPSLNIMLIGQF